jgi:small GTP-binding protein
MFEPVIKVIVIGDEAVGKTQLALRFTDDTFSARAIPTVGVDFKSKEISVRSMNYKLQVWDTAGQERFRTITRSYFRRAQGVLVVFDWSRSNSFEHLRDWLDSLFEIHPEGSIPVLLVGSKEDLEHVVKDEQAVEMAQRYGVELFSTSAKTGSGIENVFERLAELVIERQESLGLQQEQKPEKKKSFCR